ncbi:MAG: LytTR family DNA-binding domain-containing protein [Halioglobus sp.]
MPTNMKRVLIVDDEPAARAQLRDVVDSMPDLVVIGEISDGKAAIEAITELSPDIVFLDIDMPGVDGFSVAQATEQLSYQLVFVTAHHQYALKAFETHAIDYLLKPARPSIIEKCLAKILRQEVLTLHNQPADSTPSSLVLADSSDTRVIDMNNVLYIEGLGRYRRIHLSAEGSDMQKLETVLSDTTLDEFSSRLGEKGFMRVHRSYIVNLAVVSSVKATGRQHKVFLQGITKAIPVARSKVKTLKITLGSAH